MIKRNKKIQIVTIKDSDFTYGEFLKSETALRKGIKNIPNEEQIKNLETLTAKVLQPVRDEFGPILVTSGYRSIELCIAIGSSTTSNHSKGEAADIETLDQNIPLIDVLNWIYMNCDFRELIAEYFPNGWVHVAYREGDNNRQVKLKDANHNYTKCSIDYINNLYKKNT